jgi:hypothetical protein
MFLILKRGFMASLCHEPHIDGMKTTKWLLLLVFGVLVYAAPIWAGPIASVQPLADRPGTLSFASIDFQSGVLQPGLSTQELMGTVSDALPLLFLQMSRVDMGIDLLMQQTTVGPNSVDTGVGLMLTFKTP